MSMPHTRALATLALALATFSGQIVDQTTGQPLTKVHVQASGPTSAGATSDARGRFTLKALRPGRYTIQLQSDDVPQQTFHVTLAPNRNTVLTMKACSTTLDYHCAAPGGDGGGG
jgi:hypothetical protein